MRLSPASAPVPVGSRIRSSVRPDALLVAIPVVTYLLLGYSRRWVSDDGLIVTRTVRQLLAGHGPVFNVGERAEASTSALWTYLVATVSWIAHADPVRVAVYLGLLCAVAGYGLAISANCQLFRERGASRLLPAGALVLLALPPFWDFATSGLETGLLFGWLGWCWWLLVRTGLRNREDREDREDRVTRLMLAGAVLIGLGPLIRPEYALVSVIFGVAWWLLIRPDPRSTGKLAGLAVAAPLAYELFRAGYYGILVPLPAVAKEAGRTDWGRGAGYLADLVAPYRLWLAVPLVAIALVAGLSELRPRDRAGSAKPAHSILAAAPVLAGLVLALFVLRVGGDFMHGRLLLPPLFLLLMPALVVPASRLSRLVVTALAVWTLVCASWLRVPYRDQPLPLGPVGDRGISDERAFWRAVTETDHPLSRQRFATHSFGADAFVAAAQGKPAVLLLPLPTGNGLTFLPLPGNEALPWRVTLTYLNLGTAGAAAGLDQGAVDPLGLGYPLAAHAQLTERGRPGHDKGLSTPYLVADLGRPHLTAPFEKPEDRVTAEAMLACPDVRDLLASVRTPMTPSRFWHNLTGAWHRTGYRLPPLPPSAAAVRC